MLYLKIYVKPDFAYLYLFILNSYFKCAISVSTGSAATEKTSYIKIRPSALLLVILFHYRLLIIEKMHVWSLLRNYYNNCP